MSALISQPRVPQIGRLQAWLSRIRRIFQVLAALEWSKRQSHLVSVNIFLVCWRRYMLEHLRKDSAHSKHVSLSRNIEWAHQHVSQPGEILLMKFSA